MSNPLNRRSAVTAAIGTMLAVDSNGMSNLCAEEIGRPPRLVPSVDPDQTGGMAHQTLRGGDATDMWLEELEAASVQQSSIYVYLTDGLYIARRNATIGSNVIIAFVGAKVEVNPNVTLTLDGSIIAPSQTIFEGAGNIRFRGNQRMVVPEWWGANSHSSAGKIKDCTIALQKAIDAFISTSDEPREQQPCTVLLSGLYAITKSLVVNCPSLVLAGEGGFRKPGLQAAAPDLIIIDVQERCFSMLNISLFGDGRLLDGAAATTTAVRLRLSDSNPNLDMIISDCTIAECREGILAYGRNVEVRGNQFRSCWRALTVTPIETTPTTFDSRNACRGWRILNNRFHTMSQKGACCISFEGMEDAPEWMNFGHQIDGNFADYPSKFYDGPLSRSSISNNTIHHAYGTGLAEFPTNGVIHVRKSRGAFGWNIANNTITGGSPKFGGNGIVCNSTAGAIHGNSIAKMKGVGILLEEDSSGVYVHTNHLMLNGVSGSKTDIINSGRGNTLRDNIAVLRTG